MIKTKIELDFYLKADRMMNCGEFAPSLWTSVREIIVPNYKMRFLIAMRKASFYKNGGGRFLSLVWQARYKKLSMKMGYTIGMDVFGYGLVIPHRGTIIVGGSNRIGNYGVLHTSTCIVDSASVIGDGLYLSTGAIISNHVDLGNNVSIAANSTVTKSEQRGNVLLAGTPAEIKKESEAWYIRDGERYTNRVCEVEWLKMDLKL